MFEGIPESPDEGWADAEEKVKALLMARAAAPGGHQAGASPQNGITEWFQV